VKIGFCMLLWTTRVGAEHRAVLEDLKRTGYDGIEIPVFEGTPDEYSALGRVLDDIGLQRTAITVIPDLDKNPLSKDAADRGRAVSYINWVSDCASAAGASVVCGPLHQTLGYFSGRGVTEEERKRARDVHHQTGDHAIRQGVTLALEAINRFECYFVNTMDSLRQYCDYVDHPAIQAMYDTFHANIEEEDPVGAYLDNYGHVVHVHISENDRGAPGRGHVPWRDTFRAIKSSGYDGWLTIESFGRSLPELAAATRVWRDFAESPEIVYREGYDTIRHGWDAS
jgi:D-psicose/D-tagatose/L-ribulose 3-epimerase